MYIYYKNKAEVFTVAFLSGGLQLNNHIIPKT